MSDLSRKIHLPQLQQGEQKFILKSNFSNLYEKQLQAYWKIFTCLSPLCDSPASLATENYVNDSYWLME